MTRISRQSMFMEMAHVASKRSTCFRLNVGAIIVRNNRNIVSVGYNGRASGEPHCQGNDCPGKLLCRETIHAERNAIEKMYEGVTDIVYDDLNSRQRFDIYCTDSPCQQCAELINEQINIRRLFFDRKYRDEEPLKWLIRHQVECYRVTPAGYCIRYPDGEIVEI